MEKKLDWRKDEKSIYGAEAKPYTITIPKMKYFMIRGLGNPNNEDFSNKIGVLMSLSYAVRFMPRKGYTPEGYVNYGVYPLEGMWSATEEVEEGMLNKDKLIYTIMVRQPEFVNTETVKRAFEEAEKKVDTKLLSEAGFVELEEGKCVQMLHTGPFDNEPETFRIMQTYIEENDLCKRSFTIGTEQFYHKEIYLKDTRKIELSKMKTILRYYV